MNKKSLTLFSFSWIFLYILIAAFSWLAWYIASQDISLIYMPLKSYFLPVPADFDLPAWTLCLENFKAESSFRLFDELTKWIIIISQTILFVFGFKKAGKEFSFRQIFLLSMILSSLACVSLPNDSSDLFAYVSRGSQQVHYEQNPYIKAVATIKNWREDPYLASTLWQHNPAPHGPLFMMLSKALVKLSFGNFWFCLFLFKFVNLAVFASLLYFIMGFLESKESNKLSQSLKKEQIFYLLALNPFIIAELIWNGHNDILMAAAAFIAVYFCFARNYNRAVIFIFIASLIKYLSIVLLPIIILYSISQSEDSFLKKLFSGKLGANSFLESIKRIPYFGISIGLLITYLILDHYEFLSAKFKPIKTNLMLSHKSLFDVFNNLYKYISGAELGSEFKYLFLLTYLVFFIMVL